MIRGTLRGVLGTACVFALVWTGSAAAQNQRGIDPNQGLNLVEVDLANKGAALRLQLEAESYGVEFNEHYLRQNANGSVTATVFGGAGCITAASLIGPPAPRRSSRSAPVSATQRTPPPASAGQRSRTSSTRRPPPT